MIEAQNLFPVQADAEDQPAKGKDSLNTTNLHCGL